MTRLLLMLLAVSAFGQYKSADRDIIEPLSLYTAFPNPSTESWDVVFSFYDITTGKCYKIQIVNKTTELLPSVNVTRMNVFECEAAIRKSKGIPIP